MRFVCKNSQLRFRLEDRVLSIQRAVVETKLELELESGIELQ